MEYDWRSDIIDVANGESYWDGDDKLDLFRQAAERIVEENGEDYYDDDIEEAIDEEMSDIIGLWAIPISSRLYDLLLEWYGGDRTEMMSRIRDSFEWDGHIFFVTGCGYAIMSADLLGGSANGAAEREFDEWVRSR